MERFALILALVAATTLGPVALHVAHAQHRGGGHGPQREMHQGGGFERQGRGGGWDRRGRTPDGVWMPRAPDRAGRYRPEPRGPAAEHGAFRDERRGRGSEPTVRYGDKRRGPDYERGQRYGDERRRHAADQADRNGDERRGRGRRDDPAASDRDSPGYRAYPRAPGVRPGGYLPRSYRGAPIEDYRRYRLRPPPHGYNWVRVGDGFALVSPDGQIFDMVR